MQRCAQLSLAAGLVSQAWQPLFQPDGLGLPLRRCVHVQQRLVFDQELAADGEYAASTTIRKVRPRDSHDVVEVDFTFAADGMRYLSASSVLWVLHQPAAPRAISPHDDAAGSSLDADALLLPADLLRYAELSGDHNPIHSSRAAAQALGFPDVIAQGMLLLALATQRLVDDNLDRSLLSAQAAFRLPLAVPTTGAHLGYAAAQHATGGWEFQLTSDQRPLLGRALVEFAS